MTNPTLRIEPISGTIGAEILDIDLSAKISDATIEGIRKAQNEHLVVFFRDQNITPAQQLALASRFGEVLEYPLVKGLDDYPQIAPVLKLAHETVNFGGVWHSDTAYLPAPPKSTMLVARELPPFGGDTLFANMYQAYETLSDGMKSVLGTLRAVNSTQKADASATREDRLKTAATSAASEEIASVHPVVRTHPETGRKLLYVNAGHTTRFDTMTTEESAPILDYLFAHQIRPEFTCRFRWAPGSIAFWDNRAAQHNPINDYHGWKRLMHRVTLAGDVPE